MNTCPFHTQACGLSRPCSKCRAVASCNAHAIVRFKTRGEGLARHRAAPRTHYQVKRGGYWHRQAA
jgi:hypothetical protein